MSYYSQNIECMWKFFHWNGNYLLICHYYFCLVMIHTVIAIEIKSSYRRNITLCSETRRKKLELRSKKWYDNTYNRMILITAGLLYIDMNHNEWYKGFTRNCLTTKLSYFIPHIVYLFFVFFVSIYILMFTSYLSSNFVPRIGFQYVVK